MVCLSAAIDSCIAGKLDRKQVDLKKLIGAGSFGEVYHAILTQHDKKKMYATLIAMCVHSNASSPAAVKLLKDRSESSRIKFLQEAAIMAQFNHPNICRLIGIVYRSEPTLLVLEYLSGGNLHDWLLKMSHSEVRLCTRCHGISLAAEPSG